MLARAFTVLLVAVTITTLTPQGVLSASNRWSDGYTQTEGVLVAPDDTINEFLPVDRGLGDCISSVERPGCGSEARGGWRQGLVFGLILAGLGFIAWRIWAASQRARLSDPRTPGATTAPDDPGDAPSP